MNAKPTYEESGKKIGEQEEQLAISKEAEETLHDIKKCYRWLFDHSPDGILIIDQATSHFLDFNKTAHLQLGYSREEFSKLSVFDLQTADTPSEIRSYIEHIMQHGKAEFETRLRTRQGEIRNMHITAHNAEFLGRPAHYCIWHDITERKKAEEALRQNEATLRSVFKATPIGLAIMKGRVFHSVNKMWYENFGYSESTVIGHEAGMLYENKEEYERVGRELYASLWINGIGSVKTRIRRKNGVFRDVILTAGPLQMEDVSMGAVVAVEDITDRNQAEDSLKRSESLYRAIFENTGNANILVRDDTTIILANTEFEKLSGYSKAELEGRISWVEFFVEKDRNRMLEYHCLRRIDENTAPRKYECRFKDRHGNVKDIAIGVDMIPSTKESIASLHDITERKLTEKTLQESQQRLAEIIEFLPDATLVVDKDGKVIAWNRAMEIMSGVKKENMIGKGDYEYALPFYGERKPVLVDYVLYPDKKKMAQYRDIHGLGTIISAESFIPGMPQGDIHVYATASVLKDSRGEVIAAIECIRDITERKKLSERLSRAEKMESLGTLAGGVAHDLNNVLGVLVGYTELMKEYLPENSRPAEYAENILQSGARATAIIQDLLTMARRGVAVSKVVNLNKLVADYLKTPEFYNLKTNHPKVIIKTELADNLFNIKGSPVHLSKTIMNLASNAVEAIADYGEVTISTANRYLDHSIRGYDTMFKGDYAVLTVSDTGSGISAHDLSKIFEPFYTKKVMGRSGTGLGLAVVWGTVKDHNGYIDVKSEEGKGTTFTLYFPMTGEEVEEVKKAISSDYYMGKGESILVVDDVKEQRDLAINMLERLGYQVKAVASGEAAIEYIKDNKTDLIVLDMILSPGIDGLETYRRFLEINPKQKAILVSGFSETERVREAQHLGAGTYVKKPYVKEKIGMAIRDELRR